MILAGPVMSFLFGYIVLCLMGVTTGIPTGKVLTRISLVEPGGEGQQIGLRAGRCHYGDQRQALSPTARRWSRRSMPVWASRSRSPSSASGQTLTKTATPRPAVRDGKTCHLYGCRPARQVRQGDRPSAGRYRARHRHPTKWTDARRRWQALRKQAGQPVDIVVTRADQ